MCLAPAPARHSAKYSIDAGGFPDLRSPQDALLTKEMKLVAFVGDLTKQRLTAEFDYTNEHSR
jgi:hypothetical protein